MNSLSTALRTGRSLVRFGGERSAVRFSTVPAVEEAPATSNAPQREKKTRHTKIHVPKGPHNVHDAVEIVKAHSWASFNESFDIVVNTGLDPRKPNQNVKGIAKLPNGRGNKVRVCVIAQADDAEKARMAGADVAGADDVIALIQSGDVNFNAVIATPEMMASVGKIGRILGPRGLMPNPKMGTVTKDVVKAIKDAKAGAVQFKTERQGVIHAGLGKVSFESAAILENIRTFMLSLMDVKPEGFKGKYILSAFLRSSMGPGVEVDLPSVDPASPRFMLHLPVQPVVAKKK